ncbi:Hpt domain-containing protein [Pseudomonas sp.]|uniref:hybrid sensor histidine kinase/response regulator n=1 Tax=Pseudomonas sp. TaxID=306 RepID=UPI003CC5D5B1
MADRHDYVALEWVKGEIVETLKQARSALDAFVAEPHAGEAMGRCLGYLHQVHGSLQMVEFYGAALFAEEIEHLGRALAHGRVTQQAEAVKWLLLAFTQLPLYLDQVHLARRDLPLVVLPLINDLRNARGASPLAETSLFGVELRTPEALDVSELAQLDSSQWLELLRKLRQSLQQALVGLLRDQDVATHLGQLARVFSRLEETSMGAPLSPLWQVALALVEGLQSGVVTHSPALHSLLKDCDRELQRVLEEGVSGINQPAPAQLLKGLLFYVATASGQSPRLQKLREAYELGDPPAPGRFLAQDQAHLVLPDPDALRSVVSALCEELVRVKEQLDHFVRGDRQHVAELDALVPPLRQVTDTLAVLGFGQPRKVILDQMAVVHGLAQGVREPNDSVLMDVAGALLYVESTLIGMVGPDEPARADDSRLPSTDLTQIHQLVIKEARFGLQQAKDMISEYLDSGSDRERLQPLPELLTQVRGALAMIPLARAAALLEACNDYIKAHLLAEPQQPEARQLDNFADALSAIEYYLERLSEDPQAPGERLLDVAEEGLAALGYQPAVLEVPVLGDVLGPAEALVMRDLQALDSPQVSRSLAEVLAAPVPGFNPPAQSAPTSLLPPPAGEAPVDDELREVFLEETDEVLHVLREYLPRWAADHNDQRSLTELRRAFHTLKGSGRMVRALVLGELAWACENLLNRVLDKSVAEPAVVAGLLAEVLDVLPQVAKDFAEQHQRQRDDVDQLAARAHQLASAAVVPAGIDPQLLDIFRNEALGHLSTVDRFLASAEPGHALVDDGLQRALHTLKGSAYMAGVLPIAELASPFDALTREYKAHQWPMQASDLALLTHAVGYWHQGLAQLTRSPLAAIAGASSLAAEVAEQLEQRLQPLGDSPAATCDPHSTQVFLHLGMDILYDSESLLRSWRQQPASRHELERLLDELTRLGEAAQLADLPAVDELCEALLDVYGAVEESSLSANESFFDEAERAHDALIDMLDQIAAGQAVALQPGRIQALHGLLELGLAPNAMGRVGSDGITELATLTGQLQQQAPTATADDDIIAFFLDEAADILDSADQALQRWLADPDNLAPLSSLQRDLHTLKGGARMADVGAIDELAEQLERLYEALAKRRQVFSEHLVNLLLDSHEQLATMLEHLQRGQAASAADDLVQALAELRQGGTPAVAQAPAAPEATGDSELLEVFLEEGFDIVESCGAALQRWQQDPRNTLEVENLLRDLHTLKGGARMVEIAPIGDLAHELEFLYENLSAGVLAPSPALFSLLQNGHDALAHMLDTLRLHQPVQAVTGLIAAIRGFVSPVPATPLPERAVLLPEQPAAAPERAPGDMVKVAAELLEDLGNLAGETSIFRGRIEQQVNDAQVALGEMETTIERMREQLRRLDTETQGRILSRQHADNDRQGYEDFDPLEMDRHSQLQQLSRALFESASDLLDLQETLAARNHEAHKLLQLQARVNTQLQEGLMRTRMVPFERMVPRLQRLVRQVAGELGKQVEFDVANAEGEMDRSVLERMLAPLEHMLRNAVDHGLEAIEVRRATGKPEQGRITLNLLHEGGDIVIELSDDGAGIPLEAVRAKAIKRGLIEAGSVISDHDVLQFILQPGFSTAAKVTQISGRGLGMDVVHEEVKQLGGTMIIDSRAGQGARFQIRLPFSVSVNRALMVQCADEVYALPLNGLEGIVRVMPAELEDYYQVDPPRYHYGGQSYDLRYLSDLLYNTPRPQLLGQTQPLPVLLIHGQDQQMAVQVDALAGSREIVVKSLGPQFAGVQGLSGATILGDGRVVLILDLLAQVRAAHARQMQQAPTPAQAPLQPGGVEQSRPRLVMVVDDSVTVRKVTSRLLERHGMNVLTAKDGVDAMALLQDHLPDVLLLDIEMPRMDGFEVATEIRRDPRLKDLPIIMITSRTGQKHRERAMAIGVNDYLGKPYQESVLLDSIAQWSRSHA